MGTGQMLRMEIRNEVKAELKAEAQTQVGCKLDTNSSHYIRYEYSGINRQETEGRKVHKNPQRTFKASLDGPFPFIQRSLTVGTTKPFLDMHIRATPSIPDLVPQSPYRAPLPTASSLCTLKKLLPATQPGLSCNHAARNQARRKIWASIWIFHP